MPTRVRTHSGLYTGRRVSNVTGAEGTYTFENESETCEDVVDPKDNLPLNITKILRYGGLINGRQKGNLSGYNFFNYPCTYVIAQPVAHLSVSGRPSGAVLASELLNRTNPFRDEVQSLEYVTELPSYGILAQKEFKKRLDNLVGSDLYKRFSGLKKLAKADLLYHFGILPLISDIEKLLEFQKRVERRKLELDRLVTRGLKRTVDLWSGSNVAISTGVNFHSSPPIKGTITKTTTETIRGHVRWYASQTLPSGGNELREMAKEAILGYRLDPATLYELLPWSWLIDYFLNLGSLIGGTRNMTQCHHSIPTLMTHTRTEASSSNHSEPEGSGGSIISLTPIHLIKEEKTRLPASSTLAARKTILTDGQTSILGSLAVLRGLK